MLSFLPVQWKLPFVLLSLLAVIASSSWVTWQVAQRQMDKERIEIAQAELSREKATAAYWVSTTQNMNNEAKLSIEANKALQKKLQQILKEHHEAPALPPVCVIDAYGLHSLEAARNEAILSSTGSSIGSTLPTTSRTSN